MGQGFAWRRSRVGFVQADNLWRINDRLLFALAGLSRPMPLLPVVEHRDCVDPVAAATQAVGKVAEAPLIRAERPSSTSSTVGVHESMSARSGSGFQVGMEPLPPTPALRVSIRPCLRRVYDRAIVESSVPPGSRIDCYFLCGGSTFSRTTARGLPDLEMQTAAIITASFR